MARIRTVKPDFWEKDEFSNVSLQSVLLYIGMKNFADDSGVIVSNEIVIKNKVFAAREDIRKQQVSLWLKELEDNSILVPFEYEGKGYYLMDLSEERIDKPQKSKIPQEIIEEVLSRKQITDNETHDEIPESSGRFENPPAGKERKGKEEEEERKGSGKVGGDIVVDAIVIDLDRGIVKGDLWRNDFEAYLSGLRQVYTHLARDEAFISDQQKFYPGMNIRLSLEKACINYWATEAGWKNKKGKSAKSIDWKSTLTSALSQPQNKVYEQRNNQTAGNGGNVSDDYKRRVLEEMGISPGNGNPE